MRTSPRASTRSARRSDGELVADEEGAISPSPATSPAPGARRRHRHARARSPRHARRTRHRRRLSREMPRRPGAGRLRVRRGRLVARRRAAPAVADRRFDDRQRPAADAHAGLARHAAELCRVTRRRLVIDYPARFSAAAIQSAARRRCTPPADRPNRDRVRRRRDRHGAALPASASAIVTGICPADRATRSCPRRPPLPARAPCAPSGHRARRLAGTLVAEREA